MKREDYIHLHGLLALIQEHWEDEGHTVETPQYNEISDEIHPVALHKSKQEHKDAVFALVSDLAEAEDVDEDVDIESLEA